jgi:hypothetical protein
MIDRIFAPALAFLVLIGATLAIATAWLDSRTTVQTVSLPGVEIVVTRALPQTHVAVSEDTEATPSVQ